ncbi:MAG: hypothetical protein EBZ62_08285 [Sphingobacteriia bacterium]|nr:hypothetical protein [Sphingobacteriia bacterium]
MVFEGLQALGSALAVLDEDGLMFWVVNRILYYACMGQIGDGFILKTQTAGLGLSRHLNSLRVRLVGTEGYPGKPSLHQLPAEVLQQGFR